MRWYNSPMPRLERNLVFPLARDLSAFLRLDVGVGRRAPNNPKDQVQLAPQHLYQPQKEAREKQRRLMRQRRQLRSRIDSLERQLESTRASLQRVRQRGQRQVLPLPEPNETISNFQVFHSLVSPLRPGKMLDLGTGAGTFSLIAARLGWEVTAVDARTARTPDPGTDKDLDRAELVRSVRWVEADVRRFPVPEGGYDLICIMGLLHHLELDAQIKLLRRCSNTLTILAVRVVGGEATTEGRYEGRNHREPGETREERDQIPWASWGNEASFYHTEESLLRLFQDSGYTQAMVMRPPFERGYTFYVCLPAPLTKQALKLEDLPVDAHEIRYHYRNGPPAADDHAQGG